MYKIVFDKNGNDDFHSITEVACRLMCEIHDAGERYLNDSRYTFSFNGMDKNKDGFKFGTAKACVQSYILAKEKQNERFNILAITPNGSKLICKTLKEKQ